MAGAGIGHNKGPDWEESEAAAKASLKAAFKSIEGLSLVELLRAGQEALLRDLVAACQSGEASHQEKAILRNLLRDNGMVTASPPGSEELKTPASPAPLPDLPDYEG